MSEYTVDRIPGSVTVDPEAGGEERRKKREPRSKKGATRDSITISDEARRRSAGEFPGAREEGEG